MPFEILQEIYEAYLIFLRRCEEYFLAEYCPPDEIDSVGQHIRLEIDLYLKSINDKKDKHLREMIFRCLLKRECCITGCNSMNEIGKFIQNQSVTPRIFTLTVSTLFYIFRSSRTRKLH